MNEFYSEAGYAAECKADLAAAYAAECVGLDWDDEGDDVDAAPTVAPYLLVALDPEGEPF